MYTTTSTLGMPHKEWLVLRKTGLGGSDAGAICGLNPYTSPIHVYKDKVSEAIKYKEYVAREDFIADVVRSIESVIDQAVKEYGRDDDIPEKDALVIINYAKPLFDRLGPWWREKDEITIGLYKYFCETFGANPMVYSDYDSTMPPGYRKRITFM